LQPAELLGKSPLAYSENYGVTGCVVEAEHLGPLGRSRLRDCEEGHV